VKLADEAVHVTGAFHMAGYAHVIGTLWSVDDEIAAEVARDIYGGLTSHASSAPDAAPAALALHRAVRKAGTSIRACPPSGPRTCTSARSPIRAG